MLRIRLFLPALKKTVILITNERNVQVKIITDKSKVQYDVEVVQRNKNPVQYKPYCEYNKELNIILVSVPSCISTVTEQIGYWKEFVNSYIFSINKAIEMDKKSVLIPELGDNLLWQDYLMVRAAKVALENCNKCPDDFMVIFCINKEKYKLWNEMMVF